jgi:hypothetical protein
MSTNGVRPERIVVDLPTHGTVRSVRRAADGYWTAVVNFEFVLDIGDGRTLKFDHDCEIPGKQINAKRGRQR